MSQAGGVLSRLMPLPFGKGRITGFMSRLGVIAFAVVSPPDDSPAGARSGLKAITLSALAGTARN